MFPAKGHGFHYGALPSILAPSKNLSNPIEAPKPKILINGLFGSST